MRRLELGARVLAPVERILNRGGALCHFRTSHRSLSESAGSFGGSKIAKYTSFHQHRRFQAKVSRLLAAWSGGFLCTFQARTYPILVVPPRQLLIPVSYLFAPDSCLLAPAS